MTFEWTFEALEVMRGRWQNARKAKVLGLPIEVVQAKCDELRREKNQILPMIAKTAPLYWDDESVIPDFIPFVARDDLRYTDEVIATLHSNEPIWYIAKVLNISREDVLYHFKETINIKVPNVAPLTLTVPTTNNLEQQMSNSDFFKNKSVVQIAYIFDIPKKEAKKLFMKHGVVPYDNKVDRDALLSQNEMRWIVDTEIKEVMAHYVLQEETTIVLKFYAQRHLTTNTTFRMSSVVGNKSSIARAAKKYE